MEEIQAKDKALKIIESIDNISLPYDLLPYIFIRLHVRTLLRYRSISKYCCEIIDDPRFTYMHLKKSPPNYLALGKTSRITYNYRNCAILNNYSLFFLPEEDGNSNLNKGLCEDFEIQINMESENLAYYMIGSCNGLICFADGKEFHILNPLSTKDIKYVPIPTPPSRGSVEYGFGFDEYTQRFKIVFLHILHNIHGSEISVLVHNLCRSSESSPISFKELIKMEFPCLYICGKSIFVDGDLYWIAEGEDVVMVSFNLKMESTEVIPLPIIFKDSFSESISLFCLNGSLGMIDSRHILEGVIDIWVRNNDSGDNNTKIFRILLSNDEMTNENVRVFGIMSPSHILLRRSNNKYYIGDLKTGLVIEKSKNRWDEVDYYCHRGSLISPTRLVGS